MIKWPRVAERFSEIVILWILWTFFWSVVTFWWLQSHYAVDSPPHVPPEPHPSFISYWYMSVLTATNIGAVDVVPIDTTGRVWLAIYALISVGAVYAIIASY